MKKYLPALTLVALIIPSVTFATWWNPVTWFQSNNLSQNQELLQRVQNSENKFAQEQQAASTTNSSVTSNVNATGTSKGMVGSSDLQQK